jgi:basic membrane protein A and related proteins
MKKTLIFIMVTFLCIGLVFTLAEAKTTKSAKSTKTQNIPKEVKVAFVYVGPVGDGGWSYAHEQGRKALESMGIKTAYVEAVPEGAEAERVITQFASEGYNIIFTTSFGYMDTTIDVAKKFPNVIFGHCSGYKRADNVFTYFGRMYQPMYLDGIIAGKMTKANKIGYVAPHPIPEVIRHIDAFTIGARSVNPNANVHVVWTGAWYDPAKEKEAATALMDAGCDIIATEGDSPAAAQAAEARGIYSFGYDSDAQKFAPKSILTSAVWDWSGLYKDVIGRYKKGFKAWKNLDYWDGMESGTVKLTHISDSVPKDVQKLVNDKALLFKEQDNIFAGPIKDQSGVLKVKKGSALTDEEIWNISWFVEGVVGTIPK